MQLRKNEDTAFPQRLEIGEIRKQAIAPAAAVHCGK